MRSEVAEMIALSRETERKARQDRRYIHREVRWQE